MPSLLEDQLDVLIIGAGFSGIHVLHHIRQLGYSVQVFETAPDLGGVWYWNAYPGARVDSENPHYALSIPEVYNEWIYKERFPGQKELREYFAFLDHKLDLKKSISFNTTVVAAHFNVEMSRWVVETEDGSVVHPRFLVPCVGFASKSYTRHSKGWNLSKEHVITHPGGLKRDLNDLLMHALGASAVQIIQEIGPEVENLTVFQRTPNFALAMRQTKLDAEREIRKKSLYPALYRRQFQTLTGFRDQPQPKGVFSTTPEERLLHWEEIWDRGGFCFLLSNYNDMMLDENANREIYNFWRDKVRARLHDPRMQEKLAPTISPHPLGSKRPCLEETYYEVFNQPNVSLVDVNESAISKITPKGLMTEDGVEHEFEVLILATGFDSLTGSLTQIDFRGIDGFQSLRNGPTSPTAFSNGTSCIEAQSNWIVQCIKTMKENDLVAICATHEAEVDWRAQIMYLGSKTLYDRVKTSWYMGSNIPGKPVEHLNWTGGLNNYINIITGIADRGYEGFTLYKEGQKVSQSN
ncbi:hypothetical protein D9757_013932 [Collybiopsis confluens]|uniref:Cyclohexanone monooxygenase n=1 Tax=Collybiopsis confluens TaxID=2823264 RepID=A0A8H5LQA0_9AGAR|nr:hypothetical protein D9757_013932 [Collybiopsis confluens]